MSLPITVKADYKGKVRISTQKGSQLEEYITEYEREYLTKLINVEVYNDIKDTADPLPQKYLDLINGVQYTDDNGDLIDYKGAKDMLLRFIYAEYNADNFQTSIGGNVRSVNENSTVLNAENYVIVKQRYNEGVNLYEDLYKFLNQKETITTTVANQINGVGEYGLVLDDDTYLAVGDTINVLGKEYTIIRFDDLPSESQVISEAEAGLNFIGEEVSWNPCYEVKYKKLKYSGVI